MQIVANFVARTLAPLERLKFAIEFIIVFASALTPKSMLFVVPILLVSFAMVIQPAELLIQGPPKSDGWKAHRYGPPPSSAWTNRSPLNNWTETMEDQEPVFKEEDEETDYDEEDQEPIYEEKAPAEQAATTKKWQICGSCKCIIGRDEGCRESRYVSLV